ncbi:MAG: hypothetical protein RLY43_1088 [Bacteroidota bacterium]|jgi:coenzyme F420-reducing hydrogenase beta subunit
MENYEDFFVNLTDFVFKKDIIDQIKSLYSVTLTDKEYSQLIKFHVEKNNIAKSTQSAGKCAYISQSFLTKHSLDAVSYYKSRKIDAVNAIAFNKQNIASNFIDLENCIGQVTLQELFNEL